MKKIVKTSRWMVMLIVLFVGFAGGAQAQKLCDDAVVLPVTAAAAATFQISVT